MEEEEAEGILVGDVEFFLAVVYYKRRIFGLEIELL